jgi:hypothetical protein
MDWIYTARRPVVAEIVPPPPAERGSDASSPARVDVEAHLVALSYEALDGKSHEGGHEGDEGQELAPLAGVG